MTVTPNPLSDVPAVAAVDYGGPMVGPPLTSKVGAYEYSIVPGFFIQSQGPKSHNFDSDLLQRSFGMIDTSPERWANLDTAVRKLNEDAEEEGEGVKYKVFFLGRHGQGWHNFASNKYGVEEWEAHWTFQYTDGELVWGPDPPLTELGEDQARAIQAQWKKEIKAGAPVKDGLMRWFVSPLTRTGQTMLLSFGELLNGTPEVWEDWREIYGSHTCDKRSTRSIIAKRFPSFLIEDGFSEEDPYWTPEVREDDHSQQVRARRAFDRTFKEVSETYISVTAHSSILRNALAVLRHHVYPLSTGEMIPVVVKATPAHQANGNGVNGFANGNGHAEL